VGKKIKPRIFVVRMTMTRAITVRTKICKGHPACMEGARGEIIIKFLDGKF
jgi:hypothetical protein